MNTTANMLQQAAQMTGAPAFGILAVAGIAAAFL
jgi:hypothetical protein